MLRPGGSNEIVHGQRRITAGTAPRLSRYLGRGRRLQRQVGALVRDALDLLRRVAEQLVSKVGQGPRGRDLLSFVALMPGE
jgi:hypothetical protein